VYSNVNSRNSRYNSTDFVINVVFIKVILNNKFVNKFNVGVNLISGEGGKRVALTLGIASLELGNDNLDIGTSSKVRRSVGCFKGLIKSR